MEEWLERAHGGIAGRIHQFALNKKEAMRLNALGERSTPHRLWVSLPRPLWRET